MTERLHASRGRLRSLLAVGAATLASFLVVLTLLTARVITGTDPALHASASRTVLVTHGGHAVLRTTASGRVLGSAAETSGASGAGGAPSGAHHAAIVTRTSGGLAGTGARDE